MARVLRRPEVAEDVASIWDYIADDNVAASLMGLSQPDVSRLLNGQFRDISVERLMRFLTRLGCDIDITIRNHGKAASPGDTISLRQDIRAGLESGQSEAWNPEAIKQQARARRAVSRALTKT